MASLNIIKNTHTKQLRFRKTFLESVKITTDTNIDINTAVQRIENLEVFLNDRILLKNQINKKENGIYVVNSFNKLEISENDMNNDILIPNSCVMVLLGKYSGRFFNLYYLPPYILNSSEITVF